MMYIITHKPDKLEAEKQPKWAMASMAFHKAPEVTTNHPLLIAHVSSQLSGSDATSGLTS